jgi:hypothetical protein
MDGRNLGGKSELQRHWMWSVERSVAEVRIVADSSTVAVLRRDSSVLRRT